MAQQKPKPKTVKPNPITSSVRYLDYKQYQKLLSVIDNTTHKLIIRLAFDSACRISEICNLKLKDLDFNNSQISVQAELTKTGIGGQIEISEELMNDLKSWLLATKRIKVRTGEIIHPEEYLFQSRQRRPILEAGQEVWVFKFTRQRLRQIFNQYAQRAGLMKIGDSKANSVGLRGYDKCGDPLRQYTFHSLRHSGIMFLIHDLRLPLDTVRAKSRHSSLEGLSHYARPSEKMVREEIREARAKFLETHNTN